MCPKDSKLKSLGGLNDGRVFGAPPSWVDSKKAPGYTSQSDYVSLWITVKVSERRCCCYLRRPF